MFLRNRKKYDDKQIIEGLRSHRVAFERSASNLYRMCRGFIFDIGKKYPQLTQEELKDAYMDSIQATIQKVINNSYDASKSKLSTLLYQIFSNKCVDQIRRNTNYKSEWEKNLDTITPDLPVASRDFLRSMMIEEDFQSMVDVLDQLGSPCQDLVMDFDYWGFSPDDVAKRLKYKNGKSASQAKFRCMETLRKLLIGKSVS